MTFTRVSVFVAVAALSWPSAQASDWLRFRGPNGTGVSQEDQPTPAQWSPAENVQWKAALPGAGVSSPIVVGDRVFVTCYSGYGLDRGNPGAIQDLQRHLVCIDATTGKSLWDKTVDAVQPEDPYSGMGVPAHGYASHTPVSDGEHVYVFFGKTGVLAFDMEGTQLWQTSVGTASDPRGWGSASSPILYEDLVIVTAAAEGQALVGLNKADGTVAWRQEVDGFQNVWGTPALVAVNNDRTDLVLGVPNEIWGLNPANGKLRWYSEATETDQFQSSVAIDHDVVYAIEGRRGGSLAVRAGGKGDVSKTHVIWSGQDRSRFGTPVIYQGRLYYISNGVVNCLEAETGEKIFQGRLEGGRTTPETGGSAGGGAGGRGAAGGRGGSGRGGSGRDFGIPGGGRGRGFGRSADYSSPVVADGKLYYVKGNGDTFVLTAGETFQQISVNRVTDDRETFGATPAISGGRLFIRSDKHLYCVSGETPN